MNYLSSVELTLQEIAGQIRSAIGDNLIGFYVFGSIVKDSWNAETSDIDFLVVTKEIMNPNQIVELKKIHSYISNDSIGRKLEGEYIDLINLKAKNFEIITPTVKDGLFYEDESCQLSVDNIKDLIENGHVILGEPVNSLNISVSDKEFKEAVYKMLFEDKGEIDTAENFHERYYLLINALRCIYVLRTGKLPTKITAVENARDILGNELFCAVTSYQKDKSKVFEISDAVLKKIYSRGLELKP